MATPPQSWRHRPLYFLLCLLLLLSTSPRFMGLSSDGLSLLAFLNTFPLSPARDALARSWNSSDLTPCLWPGVACSPTSPPRVVSLSSPPFPPGGSLPPQLGFLSALQYLNLSSLNLTGRIHPHLANCTLLRVLDLSYNYLTGPIPREVGRLKSLQELRLNTNRLLGSISPELAECVSLTDLTLYNNQLSGSIPPELGLLTNLQILRVGGNPLLWGTLPPQLGNCSSLAELGLSGTTMHGSIPPELGRLSTLTILMLFQANFSGPIPSELGNCTQLRVLTLFKNQLNGSLPSELGRLTQLEQLDLWQNKFVGSIPPELGMLSNLQLLDLSENDLSGSIPTSFGNLIVVKTLFLSLNHLSGSIPWQLGNCSSLKELQLDRNMLSGPIPKQLGNLSRLVQIFLWHNLLEGVIPHTLANCRAMQELDFSRNNLTGPLPDELFNLQSLKKLLLLSNKLSGEIPRAIGRSVSLYRLRLGDNQFKGTIPKEMRELQNLTFFDISRNQFSGVIPSVISNCKALQLFDAHDNLLSGYVPNELGDLTNLQLLDLSNNHLTGPIPAEIGNLDELTKLDLSVNRLSGNIPFELGGCGMLTLMDLSSNSLNGPIPSSIGRIKTLSISFNVSWNNLWGEIPEDFSKLFALGAFDISHNRLSGSLDVLGKMGSLVTLNISFNCFSGTLPEALIFRSLPTSNYAGNVGLCVPSCFLSNSSIGQRRSSSNGKVIVGFLFGVVGVMLAIGIFFLFTMIKSSGAHPDEPYITWPWQITPFQKFSFTVEDVLDRLVDSNIVGKGCSGVVYKAEMPGGEVIAVKKILCSDSKLEGRRDVFDTEIETLGNIRHLNIVRLLGHCTNHEFNLLMYDYMPNGSLGELLHEKRSLLDWDTRYKIALGAAQGLSYLHHDCVPPIIHRDIKANNILLGASLEPYLADFGLAKIVAEPGATQSQLLAGSYGYIAPEYAYTLHITDKTDVYSYGVVLLEILTGKKPVDASLGEGRHLTDWVHEMRHCHHDVVDILDPKLRGMSDPLVQEMLQALGIAMDCVHPVPEERPTMRHVVSLLVGIRHDVEDYAKLEVLAAAGKSTGKPSPTNYTMESQNSFSRFSSLTCPPPYKCT